MSVVIDSTITFAWLFEDEATVGSEAVLDQLADGDAIVPAVWQLEVTNALLDAESHGRLSEAQAARMLHLLDQLPITVDHSGDDPTTVHAAARRHNLGAYQASYLVLAQRLGDPLRPRTQRWPTPPGSTALDSRRAFDLESTEPRGTGLVLGLCTTVIRT